MNTLLLVGLLMAAGPGLLKPETVAARVDPYLQAGVAHGFSGAVLVGQGDEILFAKGYGLADRAAAAPFGADTLVTIGSVTKQFTATAVMKLVEQGKMKTSDPLSRFFAELPADKQAITVHQLLTHTSGLEALPDADDFTLIPPEIFFKQLFSQKLAFEPGAKYRYSNAGYSVLGRIVERVSGQSYEAFLREHLFLPAGMQHTGYLLPDWQGLVRAHGYGGGVVDVGVMSERFARDGAVSWVLQGNGGIQSTLGDMFKWYVALRGNRILSPGRTALLTTRYVCEGEGADSFYGYGWALFDSPRGTKVVCHNGGNGVFFFDFLWLLEEDAVVLFATNVAGRETEVSVRVERMLFDAAYQPQPIRENPAYMVFSFCMKHAVDQSETLFAQIKARRRDGFHHPAVLNRIGYRLLDAPERRDWAVAVFEMNTRLFPEEGNAWDSLGEAYLAVDDQARAKASYERAVALGFEPARAGLAKLR